MRGFIFARARARICRQLSVNLSVINFVAVFYHSLVMFEILGHGFFLHNIWLDSLLYEYDANVFFIYTSDCAKL